MNKSRVYEVFKIAVALLFPFLMAFLVGNTMTYILLLFVSYFGNWFAEMWLPVWFDNERLGMLNDIANSLFMWGFFYLSIMIIFKKDKWLDRFYEFSKPFMLTVPFGIFVLIYSFLERTKGGLTGVIAFAGLISGFLIFFVLTPIVLIETVWLGILVNRIKKYGWIKSQCFSFGMFLLLPLIVTRLANWLFVIIFETR